MLLRNFQMVVPGNRSVISPLNFTANPKLPLDMKFSSPGSSKWHGGGGIGLGIVAELEKSGIGINQNPVCYSNSGLNRPDPVLSAHRFQFSEEINNHSEEYTCVTSRHGLTKVYYNNNEFEFCQNRSVETAEELPAAKKRESPEFLSLCCLCKKKLQGKDIYMYKGDKGFCSKECRSVKIMDDDSVNLQYKSENVEISSSPFAGGQISSAGIFVI